MQIKNRVNVKIESIAFGGEGVARVNNLVVFVAFAAPGDELEVEIVQRKKKFARAEIIKIIKPSEDRIEPLCRYYGHCGGCCYQHLKYEMQLAVKKKQVIDAFEKIGGIAAPPVHEIIASPKTYHYRGKAQLHAAQEADGQKLGFMDVSGADVVNIERCEIVDETINEKIEILRRDKLSEERSESGYTIWSGVCGVWTEKKETIARVVKEKDFLVPQEGFFQANLYLTDRLVDEVCRVTAVEKIDTLVDAYCGSGLFSVLLSPFARNVIGIEQDDKAIECAWLNSSRAGVKNIDFLCGKVEEILPGVFLSVKNKTNVILLDPPRTGCGPSVLQAIAFSRPRKIVYVSCNPATQARDVKYLTGQGYELTALLPLDMFAQTQHVEVIGVLEAER